MPQLWRQPAPGPLQAGVPHAGLRLLRLLLGLLLTACEPTGLHPAEDPPDVGVIDSGVPDSGPPPLTCSGNYEEGEPCYFGPPGTAYNPPCHPGARRCEEGQWVCANQRIPGFEICGNAIDDNCDGRVDENAEQAEREDLVFVVDRSGSMSSYVDEMEAELPVFAAEACADRSCWVVNFPATTTMGPFEVHRRCPQSSPYLACNGFLQDALTDLTAGFGGIEQGADVLLALLNGDLQLAWTPEALRTLLIITDEPLQSGPPRVTVGDLIDARNASNADYRIVSFTYEWTGLNYPDALAANWDFFGSIHRLSDLTSERLHEALPPTECPR